jgi:hypothetical protein
VRRTESEMEIFYRAWVLRARWWRTVFARALKWRGRLALGPYQGDAGTAPARSVAVDPTLVWAPGFNPIPASIPQNSDRPGPAR